MGTEDLLNFWFNAGFGGPGEAADAGITVTDDYDKEVSEAWELGLKSDSPGFNQDFSTSSRDDFSTLDLRIGLESINWTLTAWGKNITDEEYLQEIIPAPEFGGTFNHPSALRSYGVEFSYRL